MSSAPLHPSPLTPSSASPFSSSLNRDCLTDCFTDFDVTCLEVEAEEADVMAERRRREEEEEDKEEEGGRDKASVVVVGWLNSRNSEGSRMTYASSS